MIATRTSAGAIKKKKKSREAIKCLAEHMLMEMWVVRKSLHQSNCHNVTALFMTSNNDHVERSKAARCCDDHPRAWWSYLVEDVGSFFFFFSLEVLSQLCLSLSSNTFLYCHTHTHTHTQVHSGLHNEWLRAPNPRDQAPERYNDSSEVCVRPPTTLCVSLLVLWKSV